MFFYEGYTCPVCNQQFAPNQDVVACPVCGLPHHRACWTNEGHCHLQHLHNTDEQWSRGKTSATSADINEPVRESIHEPLPYQICPRCHTKNPQYAELCTHCGYLLQAEGNWYDAKTASEYRPYHATEPNTAAGEINGETTTNLAAVVDTKANYYLPRFRQITQNGKSGSWNWAAFIFGPFWLLYRKIYGYGAALLALQLLQTLITTIMYKAIGAGNAQTYEELYYSLQNAIESGNFTYYLLSFWLISAILFLIRIALGIFGNRLYLHHCATVIQRARTQTPDMTAGELASMGGTSMAVVSIAYIAQYFISQIFMLFLL